MHFIYIFLQSNSNTLNCLSIYSIETRVRFAQLHHWNNEAMRLGKIGCWINGKICSGDRKKMDNILLNPTFQYSTIPLFHD
jgi:hypothetical protein